MAVLLCGLLIGHRNYGAPSHEIEEDHDGAALQSDI